MNFGSEPSRPAQRSSSAMKPEFGPTRFRAERRDCADKNQRWRRVVNASATTPFRGSVRVEKFWPEIFTKRLAAARFLKPLTDSMSRRRGRVFRILDHRPAHVPKTVAEVFPSLKGKLKLHFLPGHAPVSAPTSLSGTTRRVVRWAAKHLFAGTSRCGIGFKPTWPRGKPTPK